MQHKSVKAAKAIHISKNIKTAKAAGFEPTHAS
jgi:hypothetical protein